MFLQRTIRRRIKVTGVGLHTGKKTSLNFCPAPVSGGIHFVRSDLPGRPSLHVHAHNVQATSLATTLGGHDFSVATVEHCLSTLAALRIDNLIIELDGAEIPIVDGSAQPYLEAIKDAGVIEQDEPRKYLYVTSAVQVGDAQKHAYVMPYNGLRITCTIDFPHPKIGKQKIDLDINEESFSREVASARTFGFMKDVSALQARGLALGGSLKNAIVLDDSEILNPEGLRFADEFVRHKILDALGDLVTLGAPLMGHVVLYRAGHDLMNKFVKKLLMSTDSIRFMELGGGSHRPQDLHDAYLRTHYLIHQD
jgi:UDP-3-O-[3-hydroxymyristoyl] N-acetylglucosamine deacetylase